MTDTRGGDGRAVDWAELKERLARLEHASRNAFQDSPARARELMDERARALARVPPEAPGAGELLEVAVFALGNERYGIETQHVREVIRLAHLEPVPGAPSFLAGVTNLRGEILSVVDLLKFFGSGAAMPTERSRILVIGDARAEFGVLADAAEEVATLSAAELLEPSAWVSGIGREFIRAVTCDALIVLDAAMLRDDARLYIGREPQTRG